jgi:hypothetical protein
MRLKMATAPAACSRVVWYPAVIALGAIDPQPLRDPGVHPVDGCAGAAQSLNLGRARAHPAQHRDAQNLRCLRHRGTKRKRLLGPSRRHVGLLRRLGTG